MQTWLHRLRWLHHFLASHALYPLLLSTLLTAALFISPLLGGSRLIYRFIPWNLFLAWIPYLSALLAASLHQLFPRRWWLLLIPGIVWLAFFPNAPYLLTDLIHFNTQTTFIVWRRIFLLASTIWTGVFLAIFSLRSMQEIVRAYLGSLVSWVFVFVSLGLSGIGVVLGRVFRWNSWDLLFHPLEILATVQSIFYLYPRNLGIIIFVAELSAFMVVCYLTLTAIHARRSV